MPSKILQTFLSRLNSFDDDIELVEVLNKNIIANELTDSNSPNVLKRVNKKEFGHLARYGNNEGSRKKIAGHLRTTVYGAYIKDVYEEVTQYMRTLLQQVSQSGYDPEKLLGNFSFTVDAKELLMLGSWENVCEHVSLAIIRNLERERSTLGLLKNMSDRLGLGIDEKIIAEALPYLEARHYLVHADGKPDQAYKDRYPTMKLNNGRLDIGYDFVLETREKVRTLVKNYDEAVIRKKLLRPEDIQ